jgi:hypothetical protein
MPQKKSRSRKLDKVPGFSPSSTLAEKPKRGRPTIQDNFLLGTRNAWASLLEESWAEIGWHLLDIRARGKSTMEDIRKVFEPVKQKIHNPGLASFFYRESTVIARPSEALKNRRRVGKLDANILQTQSQRDEQQRSCLQAEEALKTANPEDREMIQGVRASRLQHLHQLDNDLETLERERDTLNQESLNQMAYIYRSELLDYLLCGRYAISPRNLANALAGLPGMRWRQSHLRCSPMKFAAEPRPEFQVFEQLSEIWNQQPWTSQEPPIELFRADLLKPSKRSANTKQFLRKNWRDLKIAIDDCWKLNPIPDSFPFILTSIFMWSVMRQKTAAEQILAEQDMLER